MNSDERYNLLQSLMWDYSIPIEDIDDLLSGKLRKAGHYTRDTLFIKLLETFPWFTVIKLLSIDEIKLLLTDEVIIKLRMPSLRNKYEFVKKRLYQDIPASR